MQKRVGSKSRGRKESSKTVDLCALGIKSRSKGNSSVTADHKNIKSGYIEAIGRCKLYMLVFCFRISVVPLFRFSPLVKSLSIFNMFLHVEHVLA